MPIETKHVVLGAVGLGVVLGLVALSRKKSELDAGSPSSPKLAEPPPTPGAPASTTNYITGPTIKFRQGGRYRGRIDTSAGAGALGPTATKEQISTALDKLGLRDTIVYMSKSELEQAAQPWPAAEYLPDPQFRWFYGRWGSPDLEVDRPAGLVTIWLTASRS